MIDFVTYLEEDSNGEKWITIMHRHVKIDGNGNIIAGLGGAFNGQHMQKAMDHLSSPEGSKKNKATEEKSPKKTKQALSIIKNNPDLSSKELKDIFMKNLGMTPGQASVYLSIAKKKIAKASEVEKPEEKEPLKTKTKEKKNISLDSKEEPEEKKEEPKKDEKVKSSKKLHQAIDIFKSMPNATSKEVQAKFKSQIGMTPGMAAVYYHKIKKQFGSEQKEEPKKDIHSIHKDYVDGEISNLEAIKLTAKHYNLSASDALEKWAEHKTQMKINANKEKEEAKPKNIDDTVKNEYHKHIKDNGPIDISDKDSIYNIFKKVKEQHPEMGIHDLASKVSQYHHSQKVSSADVKSDENPKGIDKSQEDEISQHIAKLHKYKQGVDLVSEIKKKHNLTIETAYNLYKKYKKIHSEAEGDKAIKTLIKYSGDENAIASLTQHMNVDNETAKKYWENHPEVKKFKDEADKHVSVEYEKYNMGLTNNQEAAHNIAQKLDIGLDKAHKMFMAHHDKLNVSDEEKQKTADKIFADGKNKGLKFGQIAVRIQKTLGGKTGTTKYIDKAEDNYHNNKMKDAYDTFKELTHLETDDIAKASALQSKHGYSYDDAWTMLDKLKKHHQEQKKDHFAKAIDIVKNNSSNTYGDHVDNISKELGLGIIDAESLTKRAVSHVKENNKKVALQLYKDGQKKYLTKGDIVQNIMNALGTDSHNATKLYNIAQNSSDVGVPDVEPKKIGKYDDEVATDRLDDKMKKAVDIFVAGQNAGKYNSQILDDLSAALGISQYSDEMSDIYNKVAYSINYDELKNSKKIPYSSIKKKMDELYGIKVFNEHDEEARDVSFDEAKRFYSRVKLAKKVNPHSTFDPHDHLLKTTSMDYYKADQKTKNMSEAVTTYTGSHYIGINRGLRKGKVDSDYKKTIKHLDEAFAHPSAKSKEESIVYRGYADHFANNLEPGDILEDRGYMSTSSKHSLAESWAASGAVVVHILLPKGTNALTVMGVSQHPESEILLNRGAKLRIIRKERRKDYKGDYGNGYVLYAEYLPDSHSHLKEEKPKRKYTKKKVDNQE